MPETPLTYKEEEARRDAELLVRAEEIRKDKERFDKATIAVGKLLEQKKEELKAFKKIADKKRSSTTPNKSTNSFNVFKRIP